MTTVLKSSRGLLRPVFSDYHIQPNVRPVFVGVQYT